MPNHCKFQSMTLESTDNDVRFTVGVQIRKNDNIDSLGINID